MTSSSHTNGEDSANTASHTQRGRGRGRGRGSWRGRNTGTTSAGVGELTCYRCGGKGHKSYQCATPSSEDQAVESAQEAVVSTPIAAAAGAQVVIDEGWCAIYVEDPDVVVEMDLSELIDAELAAAAAPARKGNHIPHSVSANSTITQDLGKVDCSQTRVANSEMFTATSTGDMRVPAPGETLSLSTREPSIVEGESGDQDLGYANDEVRDPLPAALPDSIMSHTSITPSHFALSTLLVSADARGLSAENVQIVENPDPSVRPLEISNAVTTAVPPTLPVTLDTAAATNLSLVEEPLCHAWPAVSKSADFPVASPQDSREDSISIPPTSCMNTQGIGKLEDSDTHTNVLVTSRTNDVEHPVVKIAKLGSYPATTASIANTLARSSHSFSSSHPSRSLHPPNCLALGFTDATYQEAFQDIRANSKRTRTTVIRRVRPLHYEQPSPSSFGLVQA
ncbi:hypothetical protein BDY19DRAFT_995317 [Irpex rosettiformis]|uniref:Uncharacterized protein n=1 Tax=Irpex rosettiformis TaxID=378272 RepID=A0ACB8TYW0_9APHY|nr:hypothetical protein BDY19DRAFT_995317 [Irpex rosettiformis]